jgi:hypothetical protein
MKNEINYYQLFWKDTDILYYESRSISVIMRAYEIAGDFKKNLELRIVTKKNPCSI